MRPFSHLVNRYALGPFRYDFFVSYAQKDARIYAKKIRDSLHKLGFECFLDTSDFAKGENWKQSGEGALKRSQQLLCLVSPEATFSEAMHFELEYFSHFSRRAIVPIVFGRTLEDVFENDICWINEFIDSDILFIQENIDNLKTGPSKDAIDAVVDSFHKMIVIKRRAYRIASITAFVVFALLAVVFQLYCQYALQQVEEQLDNGIVNTELTDVLKKVPFYNGKLDKLIHDKSNDSIISFKSKLNSNWFPADEFCFLGKIESQREVAHRLCAEFWGRKVNGLTSLPKDTEDLCVIIDKAGNYFLEKDDIPVALGLYKAAAESFPEVALYHNALGYCLGKLGSVDEALAATRRAVELEPGNSEWLNDLGYTLLEMGDLEEAEVILNRAIDLAPPDYDLPHGNMDELKRRKAEINATGSG